VGAATVYSTGFSISQFPPDGLLGMGFKQISQFNMDPVFQTLVGQEKTDASIFSFKLATSGSELFIGGLDDSKYQGSVVYTPVTTEGFWQVNMDSVRVGGEQVLPAYAAIIDTGTSLVIGPSDQVATFYQNIPGSKDASSTAGQGHYTVPCDAIPDVGISFGGRTFQISADTFNLGAVSSGSNDCVGGIVANTAEKFWVIGDVFLQNVYTVFDYGTSRVGFAELA